ncbi:nuclear receptor 2C2-associated protein-like protein [Piptocephalis cylindrospora]|uniref:Nuclear receptor 2C2-associated protein-like protein n=1 Tax=Piptocephalis cylindrospora TaxID=1907219 RepID=A0A4P9Y939_9FUNG|nr:nuclear receptor 2C2-associated protein-like protein [Piptocephalis cylindrospora]|eukprot:RKP15344.1 nuclear receptor 2C2-associated protein-like protein [Piptocephalis cylindrospora]
MTDTGISLLNPETTKIRTSPVLNRDTGSFGKQHLLDGDDTTCWNSEQGTPQWIALELEKPAKVHSLSLQFQGGFVGTPLQILGWAPGEEYEEVGTVHPQDVNSMQTWVLPLPRPTIRRMKLVFPESTDFYGRVTIYQFDLKGEWVE